jgi:hypothetical protein
MAIPLELKKGQAVPLLLFEVIAMKLCQTVKTKGRLDYATATGTGKAQSFK